MSKVQAILAMTAARDLLGMIRSKLTSKAFITRKDSTALCATSLLPKEEVWENTSWVLTKEHNSNVNIVILRVHRKATYQRM